MRFGAEGAEAGAEDVEPEGADAGGAQPAARSAKINKEAQSVGIRLERTH